MATDKDILDVASLAIDNTYKHIRLFLTLLGIIVGILFFIGYDKIDNIENEAANRLQAVIDSTVEHIDSLRTDLQHTAAIVHGYKTEADGLLNDAHENNRHAMIAFDNISNLSAEASVITRDMREMKSKISDIDRDLKSMKKIFFDVSFDNRDVIPYSDALVLFLLAYQVDDITGGRNKATLAYKIASTFYMEAKHGNYLSKSSLEKVKKKIINYCDTAIKYKGLMDLTMRPAVVQLKNEIELLTWDDLREIRLQIQRGEYKEPRY